MWAERAYEGRLSKPRARLCWARQRSRRTKVNNMPYNSQLSNNAARLSVNRVKYTATADL
jgi:hypothetical protein